MYRARTAAVCANGSINHHYSTEPHHLPACTLHIHITNCQANLFIHPFIHSTLHTSSSHFVLSIHHHIQSRIHTMTVYVCFFLFCCFHMRNCNTDYRILGSFYLFHMCNVTGKWNVSKDCRADISVSLPTCIFVCLFLSAPIRL